MRRAYEKSDDKAGDYGDFGYCAYIINEAKKPSAAGITRAKSISKSCREEQEGFCKWRDKEIHEAKEGTGSWAYTANKFTAEERVARKLTSIHCEIKTVYFTRCQKGMNFYDICEELRNSEDYEASAAQMLQKLPKAASSEGTTAIRGIPSFIIDDLGCTWFFDGVSLGGTYYRLMREEIILWPECAHADKSGEFRVLIADSVLEKGNSYFDILNGRTFTW